MDGVDEPCSPTPPTGASAPERTFDVLRRPDIFTCSRHGGAIRRSPQGGPTSARVETTDPNGPDLARALLNPRSDQTSHFASSEGFRWWRRERTRHQHSSCAVQGRSRPIGLARYGL